MSTQFPGVPLLALSPNGDYCTRMGTNAAAIAATKRNILSRIADSDSNRNATALKAGIAPNTFYRKLNSCGDFTLRELGQIADALNLKLEDILKDAA